MFLPCFIEAATAGYTNAQMVYLLRDEDYFNVDEDHQGRTSSNILMIAQCVGLVWSFFAGYIYDRFMRRNPLTLFALLGALFLALCPHTSPSEAWLTVVRCLIMICNTQLNVSPLVLDFIKQQSRGKAIALCGAAILLGEFFQSSVLFGISKNENLSMDASYAISASIIACIGSTFYCIVRDVMIKRVSPNAGQDQENTPPSADSL